MITDMTFTVKLPYPEKGDRTVRIFVPAHEEGETFPVIYMTDGQTCFERIQNELGCWSTHKAVMYERKLNGRGAVIVGIHNDLGAPQRASELTPSCIGEIQAPEEMKKMAPAKGEVFDSFVVNCVMPFVEARFPVRTGRKNTAFCGSSSGGVESLYIAMNNSDIFSLAGVFSPTLMIFRPQDLAGWFSSKLSANAPFLYLYSGGADSLELIICQYTEMFGSILASCYNPDMYRKVIVPQNSHHETAWELAFRDMLHIFLEKAYT